MTADSIYRAARERRIPEGVPAMDAHCHFGKFTNFYIPDNRAERMIAAMDRLGIRRACISSLLAIFSDVRAGNDEVAAEVDRHPGRFIGLTVVNPNFPRQITAELERCYERGFRGIKLHCPVHQYSAGGAAYEAVWKFAAERKASVLVHTLPQDMPHIGRVAKAYPEATIIVAHSNQPKFEDCFKVMGENPNVYADTVSSGFANRLIERMVNAVGSEKVLFGTDVPYIDPFSQYAKVAFARLDDEAKQNIFYRNAQRIYRLG
jgi:predicted TIM-barrel fold metal-dependent hydrolase